MNFDDFRSEMASYRQSAEAEAASLKDSYLVLDRLHRLYRKFDTQERVFADRVLAEWALSDDDGVRFDALSLINDLKIKSAVSALQELANRLASSTAPGAPYELNKIRRIVENLARA